jgi:hypothetical protein
MTPREMVQAKLAAEQTKLAAEQTAKEAALARIAELELELRQKG